MAIKSLFILFFLVVVLKCRVLVDSGPADFTLVTFYVKHTSSNLIQLDKRFREISEPASPLYGQFLSHAEILSLQKPSYEHKTMLTSHLHALNVEFWDATIAGDKVRARVPFSLATKELLFPSSLHSAVDMVTGIRRQTDVFAQARTDARALRIKLNKFRSALNHTQGSSLDPIQQCLQDKAVPPCIRKAYGINFAGNNTNNSQTVVVNEFFRPSDLTKFHKIYNLPVQSIVKEVGKNDPSSGQTEATLDVQYITATGSLIPTWWVFIDGHSDDPFSDWLVYMANATVIPWVHSLSVGAPETEFGSASVKRQNAEFQALGARGASIIFASGDSGYVRIQKYGSSSPFVTSVGGVYGGGPFGSGAVEVDPISTGGFSSMPENPIQDYQKDSVAAYLKTKGERPAKLESSHRCVPDLSIWDENYYTVENGGDQVVGGTSASAPVLAGMIGLINDHLLNKGLSPLGFLNPFLYQNEDAFLDVTKGDNTGFAAVKGYDPASGLGTFSPTTFEKLLKAAVSLKRKRTQK